MNNAKYFFLSVFFLFVSSGLCQNSTKENRINQVVKGQILEKGSLSPIPSVNVLLLSESQVSQLRKSNPDSILKASVSSSQNEEFLFTSSDIDGYFKFPEAPVGNIMLIVSCMGYETLSTSILSLVPGKEMVLTIDLSPSVQELSSVIVKGRRSNGILNEMATNSARIFSLDEANRYAGSFSDVSRMAQNYAGVSSGNDGVNDIVIRGNSPSGILWRIDDIEVFNPNHYSDGGSAGGVVSMINPNVLRNSDFFTGAFPASYNNALSGVFDLRLRNGNTEKNEFVGQIGYAGFEFGAEGPLSKKTKASYVVNARYSVLSIIDKFSGKPNIGSGVPDYGDITAKFNFPTKKAGNFSLFLLGGFDMIRFDEGSGAYYTGDGVLSNQGLLGIAALSHTYSINKSTYYKLSLSYQYSRAGSFIDRIDSTTGEEELFWKNNFDRQRISLSGFVSSNLNNKLNLKTGVSYRQDFFDLSVFQMSNEQKVDLLLEQGNGGFGSVYVELSYRPLKNLRILPGLSYSMYFANQSGSLDPRIGFAYDINTKHEISFAYGHVSQMQAQWLYGTDSNQNKNLKMSKAHHFVLGWQWAFAPSFRFKTELYYQYLYQLPVSVSPTSFSIINEGTFSSQGFYQYNIPMNNAGIGQNMGIEFTFEKTLSKGWYALLTFSLFDSRYKPSNGHWYNTAFNLNHVLNVLGGKEFRINANNAIFFDTRISWTGGQRFTPPEKDAEGNFSFDKYGDIILNENLTYAERMKDYFRLDFKIGYRLNIGRTTHEFAFECQNLTNRKNEYRQTYNSKTERMEIFYQTGFNPMGFYRIYF